MTILSYQHLDLPLGGCFSILRVYTPVVVAIHEYLLGSLVDHRLDREHHTRSKHHTGASLTNIANPRILMELDTNAVTADLSNHRITIYFRMLLDPLRHITHDPPRLYLLQT